MYIIDSLFLANELYVERNHEKERGGAESEDTQSAFCGDYTSVMSPYTSVMSPYTSVISPYTRVMSPYT